MKQIKIIDNFEQQRTGVVRDGEIRKINGDIIPIYLIDSFHTLTQFVGYAKFSNRFDGNVYLRGQTALHSGMLIPSVFRPSRKNETVRYDARLKSYYDRKKEALSATDAFNNISNYAIEPLLQHYGIKTSWLDLVDNLWVALWFGLYKFNSITLQNHEHVHISSSPLDEYAYLFLLVVDAQEEISEQKDGNSYKIPGVYSGDATKLVDLRKAVQSYYLRPHAQHALMMQKKQILTNKPLKQSDVDYSDFIVGIAKIPVRVGLDWIGRNGLLSMQSLFPLTYYDHGYCRLLEYYNVDPTAISTYGSIQLISY